MSRTAGTPGLNGVYFEGTDEQADGVAQQVVTKLVQQMMEKEGGDQEGLLAALAGQEGMDGLVDKAAVQEAITALEDPDGGPTRAALLITEKGDISPQ